MDKQMFCLTEQIDGISFVVSIRSVQPTGKFVSNEFPCRINQKFARSEICWYPNKDLILTESVS